jgi:hypothetical protein
MTLQTLLADLQKAQITIGDGIKYLENVLGSGRNVTAIRSPRTVNRTTAVPGKRKLSAAAKARISDAMKKRWEARKAGKKLTVLRGKKAA